MDSKSLFSLSDYLDALSKEGDPLEVLQETRWISSISGRGWLRGLAMAMGAAIGLQDDFGAVGLRRLARVRQGARTRAGGCWHWRKFMMVGAEAMPRVSAA